MSQSFNYKGVEYPSKSQAALAMLADHMTMEQAAKELGIAPQTVFAVKKRAQKRMYFNIQRSELKIQETIEKAQELTEKTKRLTKLYGALNTNVVDGRVRRYSKKSYLSKKHSID